MSRYPGATWRPVTRYQSGALHRSMTPRRLVLHTAVSSAATMHGFFNEAGRATPHFYVNGDGQGEQYIDTDYQSTAVLNGNHDCVTVESWDNGCPGGQVPDWTPAQDEWLAEFVVWCNQTHGIPLVRLPNSKAGSVGVGWHRLGCDGNYPDPPGGLLGGRVNGGESWSLSAGKICPGDKKIRGIVDRILPRALDLLTGDDMPSIDDLLNAPLGRGEAWSQVTVRQGLRAAWSSQIRDQRAAARAAEVADDLADIAAAVEDDATTRQLNAAVARLRKDIAAPDDDGTP